MDPGQINWSFSEWYLFYEEWNRAECISLLERSHLQSISKLDTLKCILSVINGLPSPLFTWDADKDKFVISQRHAVEQMNSKLFQNYLTQFAHIGTCFHKMFHFTGSEQIRGQTFSTFQQTLQFVLTEIIEKTISLRKNLCGNSNKIVNDRTISLLAIGPYLNNDENENLLLVIRHLWEIYEKVDQPIESSQFSFDNLSNTSSLCRNTLNVERFYCNHILRHVYRRLSLPHKRIRSTAFTLLVNCLKPMFISIEQLLKTFASISELISLEFPFASKFKFDEEIYCVSYEHSELLVFWNDFIHFSATDFLGVPLFTHDSFQTLIAAIKSSFVLRKNGIKFESMFLKNGIIADKFCFYLTEAFQKYAHPEELFDIDLAHAEEKLSSNIFDGLEPFLKVPQIKKQHFKSSTVPLRLSRDIDTIMRQALSNSFETISRPFINEFMVNVRVNYFKLFNYYIGFYLAQNPHHIIQYVHFVFPELKHMLLTKSFSKLSTLFDKVHLNDATDFAPVLRFFHFHFYDKDQLQEMDNLQLSINFFNHIFFTPSFGNDFKSPKLCDTGLKNKFSNFWPLTQMFNPKVTDLFNQVFQFTLRFIYFQFLIGDDFIQSSKLRNNDLSKDAYANRFRLVNLLFHFRFKIATHFQELVQSTMVRFDAARDFEQFLAIHQHFLERLSKIIQDVIKNTFINNIFKLVSKFCLNCDRYTIRRRDQSMCDALQNFDGMNQDDLFSSFIK